jgi:hypothetical protein
MSTMDLARLSAMVDAYGAQASRWPQAERTAALQLLAESAAARALLESAAALDRALDEFVVAPPDPQLRARILASYSSAAPGWREFLSGLWRDLGGWGLVGPVFAASLTLGAVLPTWTDQAVIDLPDEDLMASLDPMDGYTEMNP